MKKFEDKVLVFLVLLIAGVTFWFIFKIIPEKWMESDKITKNTYVASDLIVLNDEYLCDSAYLGTWEVKKLGNMELFCENGKYFGEIDDIFSISMGELHQKGMFLAVFCLRNQCYSIPVQLIDGHLEDVSGQYFYAERGE